jgi:hypothetical protein
MHAHHVVAELLQGDHARRVFAHRTGAPPAASYSISTSPSAVAQHSSTLPAARSSSADSALGW